MVPPFCIRLFGILHNDVYIVYYSAVPLIHRILTYSEG